MHPREFWRATPADIAAMARGYRWRERRTWEKLAWVTNYVISPHVKKAPTMAKMLAFLGPEEGVERPKPVTPEEARAIVESVAREHKKKFWTLVSPEFAEDGDKEK